MTMSSIWEKYKDNIYIFGNIYAIAYGLIVINYVPGTSSKTLKYYIAAIYSHLLNFVVIILLPLYFVWNIPNLVETKDRRWQLQLLVNFSNTLMKYCIVIMTYMANFIYYKDIRTMTNRRQCLEDNFNRSFVCSSGPHRKFEFMLMFKFFLVNAMMLVQISEILYQYFKGSHPVRFHFQLYTFVLWNYTENMADYFYFINCSALKFLRQFQEQLNDIVHENQRYVLTQRQRRNRLGMLSQWCCGLSDRLDVLTQRYREIYNLYKDSIRISEFQILGLVLSTLISSLTNLFAIFTFLLKNAITLERIAEIVLLFAFAVIFYADTYIVTLISDQIAVEIDNIRNTTKRFAQLPSLDWRLEETIETLSFTMITYNGRFRICGLFYLNRHLTYLTAATGLTYFITLVQFDINWNKLK